ncbi:MAG: RNA polymerase sigma factor [Caulobacteraceae bacterium]|nr:RNA polymerase sigma factor [Caulobacteraceae bacterium]
MSEGGLDRELVVQARKGSAAAFAQLVARHQQAVRSFLRRVCSHPADAEDLAQETFIAAWERLGSMRRDDNVRSWLCGVAYRKSLTWRRGRARAGARDAAWLAEAETPAGLSAEDRLGLAGAMQALPPEQRAAVALCLAGGFSHTEAATALGLPLGTVKSYVERGRARLLARLETGHE